MNMNMNMSFLLLLTPLFWPFASSTILDAITPTACLRYGDVLISNGSETFALGFFTLGYDSHYLGIWYNKVSVQTIVWVANRDRPITTSDGNGTLCLTKYGNLILSARNDTVWSTNNLSPSSSSTAKLLDSGNLVLLLDGGGKPTWQSFDYPTHMYIPSMKLGLDRKTGLNWSLTSWKSADDPGTGIYSYRIDPDGSPELLLYKGGDSPLWRSGPWVGDRWSGIPRMTRNFIFDYAFIDNSDEVYLTYRVRNASVLYHLFVDGSSGTVRRRTWDEGSAQWIDTWIAPEEVCDRYANCGPFGLCNPNSDEFECSCFPGYYPKYPEKWYLRDGSGGCARNKTMISMCHNKEGFLKLANVKVPDTSTAIVNQTMGILDCGKVCLKNCSCLGYTSNGGENGRGCILFYGDLIDTRQFSSGGGQDVYYRVDALELAKARQPVKGGDHHRQHKKLLLVLALTLCGAFICILFFSATYWFLKKKRKEWREQKERSLWLKDIVDQDETNTDVHIFDFSDIVEATQNFNNQLGQGGFGAVFKGTLPNGQQIAVKRLAKDSGQGMTEFKNEVRLIAKLQHKNLVKTLGCCIRGDEKMLVYEYLPNRSLDKYIFGEEEKRLLLNWMKRYDIVLGIARGLLYLHQDSRLKIIHRDLKASNVLLDSEMDPKISDFGIARIFGSEEIEASTNRVVGTYGYMSPEYAVHGLISTKLDVFSFGVVALEIMSGKKSSKLHSDQGDNHPTISLISLVWRLWRDGNVLEVVDPLMSVGYDDTNDDESYSKDKNDIIMRCIQISLLCVQDDSTERPSMSEVVFMLSNKLTELPSPKEPAFIIKATGIRKSSRCEDFQSTSSTSGAQGSLCTTLEAR